jgi:excisionase family DNA binding protein
MAIDPDILYTVAEVAAVFKCGKTNVYDLLESGSLAVTRIGANNSGLRVLGADLSVFIQSKKSGGPAPKSAFKYLKI